MYLVAVAYKLHLLLFKGGGDHNELLLNSFAWSTYLPQLSLYGNIRGEGIRFGSLLNSMRKLVHLYLNAVIVLHHEDEASKMHG